MPWSPSCEPQEADVLVVASDARLREHIVEVLETAGYTVCRADDGFVAIDRLRSMRLGVVVLDLVMPVMDGLGVLAHFDGDLPPVILMSPDAMFDRMTAPVDSPVFAHLREPAVTPILLAVVAAAHEAAGWRLLSSEG